MGGLGLLIIARERSNSFESGGRFRIAKWNCTWIISVLKFFITNKSVIRRQTEQKIVESERSVILYFLFNSLWLNIWQHWSFNRSIFIFVYKL